MENREQFLVAIARKLGRPLRQTPEAMPEPVSTLATTRLTELTVDQRCDAFIKFASEVMLAECVLVSPDEAASKALDICGKFGYGPVIISNDQRLVDTGIAPLLQKEMGAVLWDPEKGEENIHIAEKAKTGVVFAEYGLTESGGVVLFSAPKRGRSVSLCLKLHCLFYAKIPFSPEWRSLLKNFMKWLRKDSECLLASI